MTFSTLSSLQCPRCGEVFDPDQVQGTCSCGSPLLARYDLDRVAATLDRDRLTKRAPTLWRYHELLPVRSPESVVSLGEGMTPVVALPRLGEQLGVPRMLMKDEGLLPTGTFKARGAAVGVSRAAELGVAGVAMPTNGNAGAAWATYAVRAGLQALIAMPVDAPTIARVECQVAGVELYLVEGLIGDAGRLIGAALTAREGYQNVSTLKEPYRLEGKKTMGLELVEQLDWRMPDVIVYPAGGGVGLIGINKGLCELRQLGWINGPLPRLVAVQASGCAPIVRAYECGARESEPWSEARTVAFGITVPQPVGDFLILDAIYATGGTAVAVDDAELLAAQRECAHSEGAFVCPEGAATFSAVRRLRADGWLDENEEVVVLNTGTGVKYPESVQVDPPVVSPAGPPAMASATTERK